LSRKHIAWERRFAAHAIGSDGIADALRAGVDTIEHGDFLTDQLMDEVARKRVYYVPTLTVDHSFKANNADFTEFLKKS
jgi:imidazolonepropionase-like amidohydrolase